MCRAYKAAGIAPVVRILKPDPYLATQALDAGACSVLSPYTEDPELVAELVGAVRYRPLKGKMLREILTGKTKPDTGLEEYIIRNNRNNSLLLNIESPEGVGNMESFLSVGTPDGPGVDGIVLGPHDLSVSFSLPGKYESSEFLELSTGIIKKARTAGISAGGHNGSRGSLSLQLAWAEAGANIIMHSSDIFLFADKYAEDINRIRKITGDKGLISGREDNV
jgi:4-hydroxy-2-oxoheptanedioate aldolase